jgi:hypothetical protein
LPSLLTLATVFKLPGGEGRNFPECQGSRRAPPTRVGIRISINAPLICLGSINANSSELRLLEPDVRE